MSISGLKGNTTIKSVKITTFDNTPIAWTIGTYAFQNCTNLETINFGGRLKTISSYAFDGCENLQYFDLPATLKSVEDYAFRGCTKSESITIPASVNRINMAIQNCTALKSVKIETKKEDAQFLFDYRQLAKMLEDAKATNLTTVEFSALTLDQLKSLTNSATYNSSDSQTIWYANLLNDTNQANFTVKYNGGDFKVYKAATTATCTQNGNPEYYYDYKDRKYYSDSSFTTELDSIVTTDSDHHTGTLVWVSINNEYHQQEYNCCHVKVGENEAHRFSNGVCSDCSHGCNHSNIVLDTTIGVNGYTWATDYSSCTAHGKCNNSGCSHTMTVTAIISSSVTTNIDCTHDEMTTHTATFESSVTWATTQTKEEKTADKLGHNCIKTETKPATCTATGNIEYWTCSRCNKIFIEADCQIELTDKNNDGKVDSDDTVIAKLAHNYVAVEGVSNLYKCSYCNKEFKASSTSTWELLTDVSNLKTGSRIIIVGMNNENSYYALGTGGTNNRKAVTINVSDNKITTVGDSVQLITVGVTDNGFTLCDNSGKYFYASGAQKHNYLATRKTNDDNKGIWSIDLNSESTATIKATDSNTTRNLLRFNTGDSSNLLFSCYASGQKDVYIYIEKVAYTPIAEHTCADNVFGATCTADGVCSICGRTVDGSKLGHTYDEDDYSYNNDATCQKAGTKTATCGRCGHTDTIEDSKHPITSHVYDKDGNCTYNCGTQCNVVYLDTNVWNTDSAWFAARFWNDSGEKWVKMPAYNDNGIYYAFVPADMTKVIFVRMSKDKSELSWDSKWDQSQDIELSLVDNKAHYTVVAYGDNGANSIVSNSYTAAGGISDENGGLFGTAWNTGSTDNALVFNPNTGLYYKLFENVTAQGTYNFKVVVNQSWTLSYGDNGNNVSFTVSEGDNVMLTFDFFTKKVKAETHTHSYTYTINEDNTHSGICSCGSTISSESHDYKNGYCVCGKLDETYYFPKNIADLSALEDGTKVEFTGTVISIDTAWSDYYSNISVTVSDGNGNTFPIYRLAIKVELCDVITVNGVIGSYNNSKQIGAGATATIADEKSHTWNNATCTAPKTCFVCSITDGDALGHIDENNDNKCDRDTCGADLSTPSVTYANYSHTFGNDSISASTTSMNLADDYNTGYSVNFSFDFVWKSSSYVANENDGLHIGSNNNPASKVTIKLNDISGEYNTVKITVWGTGGSAKMSINAGKNSFVSNETLEKSLTGYTFTANDFSSGELTITITNTSKAIWIKSISVTGSSSSSEGGATTDPDTGNEGNTSTEGGESITTTTTESIGIYAINGTLSSDRTSISWSGINFTVTNNKGSNAIRSSDEDHYRAYAGSSLIISSTNDSKISKIVITCASSSYASTLSNCISSTTVSVTNSDKDVTITVIDGTIDSLTINLTAKVYLSNIEVTFIE